MPEFEQYYSNKSITYSLPPSLNFEALFPVLKFVVDVLVFVHGLRDCQLVGHQPLVRKLLVQNKEFENSRIPDLDGEDIDVLRRPELKRSLKNQFTMILQIFLAQVSWKVSIGIRFSWDIKMLWVYNGARV